MNPMAVQAGGQGISKDGFRVRADCTRARPWGKQGRWKPGPGSVGGFNHPWPTKETALPVARRGRFPSVFLHTPKGPWEG